MSLHVVNKTDAALWSACRAALSDGDALLLIEDAVFAVLPGYCEALRIPPAVQILVLSDDLAARGISARIPADLCQLSYQDFVALSLRHDKVVSWN